jgi:hypothetical protein
MYKFANERGEWHPMGPLAEKLFNNHAPGSIFPAETNEIPSQMSAMPGLVGGQCSNFTSVELSNGVSIGGALIVSRTQGNTTICNPHLVGTSNGTGVYQALDRKQFEGHYLTNTADLPKLFSQLEAITVPKSSTTNVAPVSPRPRRKKPIRRRKPTRKRAP